ncbi:hypothetical protein JHW43_002928 [Diplocarpon mali]|nr:hypothetical protein JHW43_002928 [Diplocarpon mali]
MSAAIPRPQFTFEPLPTQDHIRLLRLAEYVSLSSPGIKIPVIHASIEVHEIRKSSKFRALSYTSSRPYRELYDDDRENPPEPMSEIVCNGKSIPVTRNLFDALQTLQKLNVTGPIWIHGVCIDYGNIDERSSQALKMKDIYSNAEEVIVWLGPHRRGIEELSWATEQLLPSVASPSADSRYRWDIKDDLVNLDMRIYELWTAKGLEFPLEKLLNLAYFYRNCRWFTRAWSVPEVLLAKRVSILCGETFVAWERAVAVADLILSRGWSGEVSSRIARYFKKKPFKWALELGTWNFFRDSIPIQDERSIHNPLARAFHTFAFLATSCRELRCTDPRDQINSLLGIVLMWHPDLAGEECLYPDYRVAYFKLRATFTSWLLHSTGNFDLIADYFESSIATRTLNLSPSYWAVSWAPDYSSCSPPPLFALSSVQNKSQGPIRPWSKLLVVKSQEGGLYINVRAVKVSTIRTVQPFSMEQVLHPDACVISRIRLFQFFSGLPRKINFRTRLDVFWRTMAANYVEGAQSMYYARGGKYQMAQINQICCANTVNWLKRNLLIAIKEATKDERSAMAWIKNQLTRLQQDIKAEHPEFLGQFEAIIQSLSSDESPDEKSIIGDLQHKSLIESSALTCGRQMNQHYLDKLSIEATEYSNKIARRATSRGFFLTENDLLGLGNLQVQKVSC